MTLDSLKDKSICILGLGTENATLVNFLLRNKVEPKNITICDTRNKKQLGIPCKRLYRKRKELNWQLEKKYDSNLCKYDIIFRIAGYPLFTKQIIKAMMAGVEISSPTKLFFDLCPTKNIIGVTGTKGKGTTSSLIYKILHDAGKRVHFGGNIGIPMFSFMDKIKKKDWVVLELSSFQLEDLHKSPKIAIITNFFTDHLTAADPNNPNYHKTMKTYWDAKDNIYDHQKASDTLIINPALKDKFGIHRPKSKVICFASSNLKTPLPGGHNKKNIAAAVLAARKAGVKMADIKKSVASFRGLEHRIEFVANKKNIRYYNDSFATAPDATIIALRAFNSVNIILIAGGSDKGSDFKHLIREIKKRVKNLILLPSAGSDRMLKELQKAKFAQIEKAKNMKQAVRMAKKHATTGDVVLLSPACASFGIFKNYKERGNLFKEAVRK